MHVSCEKCSPQTGLSGINFFRAPPRSFNRNKGSVETTKHALQLRSVGASAGVMWFTLVILSSQRPHGREVPASCLEASTPKR